MNRNFQPPSQGANPTLSQGNFGPSTTNVSKTGTGNQGGMATSQGNFGPPSNTNVSKTGTGNQGGMATSQGNFGPPSNTNFSRTETGNQGGNYGNSITNVSRADSSYNNQFEHPNMRQNTMTPQRGHLSGPIDQLLQALGFDGHGRGRYSSLKQFFVDYDAFESRIFDQWELLDMFPTVNKKVFEELHHLNNKNESLKDMQISLRFLIREMEIVERSLQPFLPSSQSMYVERTIQIMSNANQNQDSHYLMRKLQSISQQCGNFPEAYFDQYFRGGAGVDFNALRRSGLAERDTDQQLTKLFNFFLPTESEAEFKKISFCRALIAYNDCETRFKQQVHGNSVNPQMMNQFGASQQQMGFLPQQQTGFTQQAMPQAQQMTFQHPQNPQFVVMNAQSVPIQQPMQQFSQAINNVGFGNQQTPFFNQKDQIDKDSWTKTMLIKLSQLIEKQGPSQSVEKMFQSQNKTNIGGHNVIPQTDFEYQVQQLLKVDQMMARKLSQVAMHQQQPGFVDLILLQQAILTAETVNRDFQFEFKNQLLAITDAVKLMYLSPFEFFKTYCSDGRSLSKKDFMDAMGTLDKSSQNYTPLFLRLSGESQLVPLTEMTNILKMFSANLNNKEMIDRYVGFIFTGCNNDLNRVLDSINQCNQKNNGITLKVWCSHWMNFKDSLKFFNVNNLVDLGQIFIKEEDGTLAVNEVRDLFRKIYEDKRLIKGMNQSILDEPNKETVPLSQLKGGNNPFTSGSTKTMTESENRNVIKPVSFQSNAVADQLEMVLMGLAIKRKTALELFEEFKNYQGVLNFEDFFKACQKGLELSMEKLQLQNMFDDIARQLQGNRSNTVTPEMIDQYFFFSLHTSVQDQQEKFLLNLEKHYQNHMIDIEKEFLQETMVGKIELTKEKFNKVAFKGTRYPAQIQNFLATMYMQIGGLDIVKHQKFLDDIKMMTKRRKEQEGFREGSDFTEAEFTDRLLKITYFSGQNLAGVIGTGGNQRFQVYQQSFFRAITDQLGFGREWETFLRQLWAKLNSLKQESIEFNLIERWICQNTKHTIEELTIEIWRSLINQNKKVQVIFDNDLRYNSASNGKRIQTLDFASILKANWRITELDADFFAKKTSDLQGKGAGVDANVFIQEWKERERADSFMDSEDLLAQSMIKAFAFQAKKLNKVHKLNSIFETNLKSDSKDGAISEKGFRVAYLEVKPDVTYNEFDVLKKKYASASDRNYINYRLFLNEINKILSVAIIFTEESKQDASQLYEMLKKDKKEEQLWKALKLLDRDDTLGRDGYLFLTEEQILKALLGMFNLAHLGNADRAQVEKKIRGLVTKTEKDRNGCYSAIQFMEVLMGNQIASQVMDSKKQQQNVTFQGTPTPQQYQSESFMPRNEQNPPISGHAQPLNQNTAQSQNQPIMVLDEKQRKECQMFILSVRKHCTDKNLTLDKLIADYYDRNAETIPGQDFVRGLDKICRDDQVLKTTLKTQRNEVVTWVIFYLMKGDFGKVNVKKLKEAWAQRSDDLPLKQDGTEQTIKYQATLKSQLTKIEQQQLFAFMRAEGKEDFLNFFNVTSQSAQLPISEIELKKKFDDQNFQIDKARFDQLVYELRSGSDKASIKPPQVSMHTLYENFCEFRDVKKAGSIKGRIDTQVQKSLDEINKYLAQVQITVKSLFVKFDINNDGTLSREEFINGCRQNIHVNGLDESHFRNIYNAMDLNQDQKISINEFGMYLQTSQVNVQAAVKNLDAQTKDDVQRQIRELFTEIDVDNDGTLNARELCLALNKMCDMQCTQEQAQGMIDEVDTDGNHLIDAKEFEALMMPRMLENIVRADNADEKFRAIFKKYDTDLSNYLTCDELYTVLIKEIGVQITVPELMQLLAEFDVDGNGKMDIDEFVALMSADNIQFQSESSQTSFNKIRSARKFDQKNMLKIFLTLPKSFVNSFMGVQWSDFNKNTPSCVFAAQIDPKTMMWKDMQRPKQTVDQAKSGDQPKLKPIPVSIGGLMTIEKSEGVPLPKLEGVQKIVKRVMRVAIYDAVKKDFMHNSCQVPAELEENTTDTWTFDKLNPILFRSSKQDQQRHPDATVILELVIYVSQDTTGDKVMEMSCGWAQIPLDFFTRASSSLKIEIQGGTPKNVVQIAKDDLNIKRDGVKKFMQMFTPGIIKSVIVVSIKPHTSMPREEMVHLECLPATCLIQKKLLWFVSGYRNYAADTLHKENTGKLQQPPCNVVMSCLPKILDNPDIVEALSQVWAEDVLAKQTVDQKKNIEGNMRKSVDYIQRLYPAIFSDVFGWSQMTAYTALPPGEKKKARDFVLKSALRYGNSQAKEIAKQPLEDLTSFKPFNIRELEFLTFDDKSAKKEMIAKQLAAKGMYRDF